MKDANGDRKRVAVVGAGTMGSTLVLHLLRAGHDVRLLATPFDARFVDAIASGKPHPELGLIVPSSTVFRPDSWREGLEGANVVALAVASVGARKMVREVNPLLEPQAIWAVATKGWDDETAQPLSEVIGEESPDHPVVIMVGPSLAPEIAREVPTALVCASRDREAASVVAKVFGTGSVRTYVTDDVAGVEVGSAVKNVLAIAIGMCDGVAESTGVSLTNTKAALFSRGLVEMARLAVVMGGRKETVLGLAGAGDLFVTVLGGRNGRFGRLVGGGMTPTSALQEMNTTVEGYVSAVQARRLVSQYGLRLPIVEAVYSVLYEGLAAERALRDLLSGEAEPEILT